MRTPIFANTNENIREYTLSGGASYVEGAAVVLSSGNAAECGADPASILGFACHDAGALPDTTKMLVSVATGITTFFGEGSRAPLASDVGVAYGLAKDSDGIWYIDCTDTVNPRVKIEKVDLARSFYEFVVLAANRQMN